MRSFNLNIFFSLVKQPVTPSPFMKYLLGIAAEHDGTPIQIFPCYWIQFEL
jgi:hypothetical protein